MNALAIIAAMLAAAPDFVDVAEAAPGAIIDMRYAGASNFVGERIDGYSRAKCLLTRPAADALAAAAHDLAAMNLRLRIFDCYRPQRAVNHFMRWSQSEDDSTRLQFHPAIEKSDLFALGYIAERSGHSRGSTVDLTIDGLDMGSSFDFFDEMSHAASEAVSPQARANRLLLRVLMESRGFRPYDKEWWHFTLEGEPYKDQYFDVPVK